MRPAALLHTAKFTSRALRIAALAVAVVAVVAAGFVIGSRVGTGQQPDRTGDLGDLLERSSVAVVYSEFGQDADTIWAASASDPSDRVALGDAPHRAGYAVFPALSPDGTLLAYVAAGGSGGEVSLLDIASGETSSLATGVDLAGPVWSDDSDALFVSSSTAAEGEAPTSDLLRIDLEGAATTIASTEGMLYPIDVAPAGKLLYASLSDAGTDLHVVDDAGGEVVHLSDGIARDWTLSPDGGQLAYLAPRTDGGYAASVVDLATGQSGAVASDNGPEFHPVWAPDGSLTVGRGGHTLDATGEAAGSSGGFDVPLAWSPDGAYLIVRHFEGTLEDAGASWVWAIDTGGTRHRISDLSDVQIAGWLVGS